MLKGHLFLLGAYAAAAAWLISRGERPAPEVLWASMGVALLTVGWVGAARRRWLASAAMGGLTVVVANAVALAALHRDGRLLVASEGEAQALFDAVIPFLGVVEIALLALVAVLAWVLSRPGERLCRDSAA